MSMMNKEQRKNPGWLNLALAGAVIASAAGLAVGQAMESRRVGGQYTCVGGKTIGGYTNMIYVLDSANSELVSLKWNDGSKQLEGHGYRDLVADVSQENDR